MVILGIGDSFLSGALEAWISDEIGEGRVGKVYMCGSQISQIAILAGIPIGSVLGTINLSLPMILSGFLYLLLGLALIKIMPEKGFQPIPAEERKSWRTLFQTFGDGIHLVQGRPILITILVISAVAGFSIDKNIIANIFSQAKPLVVFKY